MDPDSLADGLLFFKFPDLLAFSISFGYRILPLIMEEFQGILLSHQSFQYGCLWNRFEHDLNSVKALKEAVKEGAYSREILDYIAFKVETASTLKRALPRCLDLLNAWVTKTYGS